MTIKEKICMLLSVFLLFFTTGGAFGETAKPDYYHIGLEVTDVMGEIADSEAYLSMIGMSEMIAEVREKVNTHDYDRPVAVYSISFNDPHALLYRWILNNENSEIWNSLSSSLQEQILNRINIYTLCNNVTGFMGPEYIAFTSLATATITNENLTAEDSVCYLYFFEEGTPILVSFGYHVASGRFIFIPKEVHDSPEAIWALLATPGLKITPVEVTESTVLSATDNLAAYGIDLEDAIGDMKQSIAEQIPSSGRILSPVTTQSKYELFDVTGDGCADLCTSVICGNSMIRTDLVVYDPLNEDLSWTFWNRINKRSSKPI